MDFVHLAQGRLQRWAKSHIIIKYKQMWNGVLQYAVSIFTKYSYPEDEDRDGLRNVGFLTAQPFDPADSPRELHHIQSPGKQQISYTSVIRGDSCKRVLTLAKMKFSKEHLM
jgi:hypothetical protein